MVVTAKYSVKNGKAGRGEEEEVERLKRRGGGCAGRGGGCEGKGNIIEGNIQGPEKRRWKGERRMAWKEE